MTRIGRSVPCAALFLIASSIAGCGDDDGDAPTTDGGSLTDGTVGDGGTDGGEPPDGDVPFDGDVPPDGDADGGDPPVDGGMPFELVRTLLCEPLARAQCTVPWDCNCDIGEPRPDEMSCTATYTDLCVASLASSGLGDALTSGRVTIDAGELAECGRRVDAGYATCSGTMLDFNVWCHKAFVDAARIGESCTSDSLTVCAGGEGICTFPTCIARTPMGGACDPEDFPSCAGDLVCFGGTCVAPRGDGETCDVNSHCGTGLFCVGGTCRAMFGAAGSTCSSAGDCDASASCTDSMCVAPPAGPRGCGSDDQCGSLESCRADFEGRCLPPIELGMPCESDSCVSTAYCDFGGTGTCVARPGDGEPCSTWCAAGYYCSDTAVCRPLSSTGGPCAPRPDTDGCQEGLACVVGTCQPTSGLGGPCGDDGECAEGYECIYTPDPTCQPPRGLGETCDGGFDGNDCAAGSFCDFMTFTCAPYRGETEACFGSRDECGPGYDCTFDPATGSGPVCTRLPADGEVCTWACASPGSVCIYGPVGGTCYGDVCTELPGFGTDDPPPPPPPTTPPPPR